MDTKKHQIKKWVKTITFVTFSETPILIMSILLNNMLKSGFDRVSLFGIVQPLIVCLII